MNKKDFVNILILTTITLAIGSYLIATSVLISKDGVFYINQAKLLESDITKGIKEFTPGYQILILVSHKIASVFYDSNNQLWAYSGQSASLLCRLLAITPLYLIGKRLVGQKQSFIAILILIFLPYPAEYGSDIVREWPHLLMLSTAFLFLIEGSLKRSWIMFATAGFLGGLGYWIRPESMQIVLYCIIWLILSFIKPNNGISRSKAFLLTIILIVCFSVPVFPYIKISGDFPPEKLKEIFDFANEYSRLEAHVFNASFLPKDILMGLVKLAERISENLIYYFVVPAIIGIYDQFRKPKEFLADSRFFIFLTLTFYTISMLLLFGKYGYLGRRHCLPMVIFAAFYIPCGLW